MVGFADTGEAACGGGVKALGDGAAEIKRFYVAPAFRGQGLARALLEALEEEARRLGHRTVRLDTTTPTWPMYLSAGYRAVADYNGTRTRRSGARRTSDVGRPGDARDRRCHGLALSDVIGGEGTGHGRSTSVAGPSLTQPLGRR